MGMNEYRWEFGGEPASLSVSSADWYAVITGVGSEGERVLAMLDRENAKEIIAWLRLYFDL